MLANENRILRDALQKLAVPGNVIAQEALAATSQPASLDAEYGELRALAEKARSTNGKSEAQIDADDDAFSCACGTSVIIRLIDSRAQLIERVAVLEAAKPAVADKQFMRNLQDLLEDDTCSAIERLKIASLAIDGAILAVTPHPHADEAAKVEYALNTRHPNCHQAADAFWKYWNENGETHKRGYYESTLGAINRAIRMVGVVPHVYSSSPAEGKPA